MKVRLSRLRYPRFYTPLGSKSMASGSGEDISSDRPAAKNFPHAGCILENKTMVTKHDHDEVARVCPCPKADERPVAYDYSHVQSTASNANGTKLQPGAVDDRCVSNIAGMDLPSLPHWP